jgi:hypothetical protein
MSVPPLPMVEPRVRLIYSPDTIVIYNPTGEVVSLDGVSFRTNETQPLALTTGTLAAGKCLGIVNKRSAADHVWPLVCNRQLQSAISVDSKLVFWATHGIGDITRSFRVERNGEVLQVCWIRLNTCEFAVP